MIRTNSLPLLLAANLALGAGVRAQNAHFFRISGPVACNITAVATDGNVTWTNQATNATFIVQVANSLSGYSNWADYVHLPVTNPVTTHRLFDPNPPSGMAFIPGGSFVMGDCMSPDDGDPTALPLHNVWVSALYMDRYEVTKALWDEVYAWAITHGYSFEWGGTGKLPSHPAQSMTWYDAVKWCNARSEKEGRQPAYYLNPEKTTVYRAGQIAVQNDWVYWDRGYRLPTEAEWEKAARGGASGRRFPWSNADTINHGQANYFSYDIINDISPTRQYHPMFNDQTYPYTSPVGYFAPNGYGLYDMAGNVLEWCWDWNGSYTSNSQTDPQGPSSGSGRIYRGGCWSATRTLDCRAAVRSGFTPDYRHSHLGFRSVLVLSK